MPIIEVDNLSKQFGEIKAVDGVSFKVEEGEVFGFLGPNGAGKTTTINMLCTLLRPTSGQARVAGLDVIKEKNDVRRTIGLVFQETTLDDYLTAEQNILFHALAYGVPSEVRKQRTKELLTLMELWERRKSKIRTYSGGMKRRLEIARGLVHLPRVLFLDEPTLGLDPQTRNRIWEYILDLREKQGLTIFLTTHYMDEAEHLADHIALMSKGSILSYGTVAEIIARQSGTVLGFKLEDAKTVLPKNFSDAATIKGNKVTIRTNAPIPLLYNLTSWALDNDQNLDDLRVEKPTLEDVYLDIVRSSTEKDAKL